MKKILSTGILIAIISLMMLVIPASTMKGHAVLTGTVCIAQSTTATACPSAPLNFAASASSSLTVTIFIQGSDALNGVDMSVMTDPTILNPTATSFCTGSTYCNSPPVTSIVAASPLVLIDCINGAPVANSGGSCNSYDGSGIASIGILNLGGGCVVTPCTGLIFTVTYHVIATTPAAIDVLVDNTNCMGQSVSSANDCILVSNGAAVDPETALVGAPVNGVMDANALATVNSVTRDDTTTAVSCSPASIAPAATSTCTATVTDTTTPS